VALERKKKSETVTIPRTGFRSRQAGYGKPRKKRTPLSSLGRLPGEKRGGTRIWGISGGRERRVKGEQRIAGVVAHQKRAGKGDGGVENVHYLWSRGAEPLKGGETSEKQPLWQRAMPHCWEAVPTWDPWGESSALL